MQLKLHTETTGHGPDLYLVHGWSLHSGVWGSVLPELAQSYRVTCVDLPGHGRSSEVSMPRSLAALSQLLVNAAPEYAVWLGWSLGGLACLRAAMDFPVRLRALALVSTTPRFITAADWPHAMPLERLQEMAMGLRHDYHRTVQRFLTLQVHGDAVAHATLRQLRTALFAAGESSPANLERGLILLRDSDLRAELARIHLPTLIIAGEHDRLTPSQAGQFMAAAVRGAQCLVIPKTAHVPFLSHPTDFKFTLKQFLKNLSAASPAQAGNHTQMAVQDVHQV